MGKKDTITEKRGLIIVPYAHKEGFKIGANVRNLDRAVDMYMKNCCVACASAQMNTCENTDVVFVSNIVPPEPYKSILERIGIKIIRQEFDVFNFGGSYSWSLAFYKLCAIFHVIQCFDYDYYAYLDSDVYVQGDFENIWRECDSSVMMYDINHGLHVQNYRDLLAEIRSFEKLSSLNFNEFPVHYGGEFFAANKDSARRFVQECEKIYNKMTAISFVSHHGDEFITTLAAANMCGVKNAGAYVCRFWTRSFRLLSTCYEFNPVVVLHVPGEKEFGMIKVFRKYIVKGRLPQRSELHRILHLKNPSLRTRLIPLFRKLRKAISSK